MHPFSDEWKISSVRMSMREGQAYKNLANTLKTICVSGASWTRCNFSLCSYPYSIPSLWLSVHRLPWDPHHLLAPTACWGRDSHSRLLPWLQSCHIQFPLMPFFFLTGEDRVSSRCPLAVSMPPLMILQISILSSQHLSLFQVDGVLLSIWCICFSAIGKWHWPPLLPRSNCFLSKMKLLGKWNKFIFPCCKSTCECLSTNLIFHWTDFRVWVTFHLTYVLFPSFGSVSKKIKYFHFPICLVFLVKGGM